MTAPNHPSPTDRPIMAARRRLYLMRHGSVDYFLPDGTPVPPDKVPLNAEGRDQADAAGALFASAGVQFDHVLVSGLPRTVETATRVLAAAGSGTAIEVDADLVEIRAGRLADIPPDGVREAFLGAFEARGDHGDLLDRRFLGGETVNQLLDRCLPAWERFLARNDWSCALLVLHGGVNRALLSQVLSGTRSFFGALEQSPACINVLDIGSPSVVRGINLAPTRWLQDRERMTTMEKMLALYLRQDPHSVAQNAQTTPNAP